ncbi:energy-coupling factor ABC transporter ATP-binding protein [Planktothrix serta]|uniref:energy-coupling factor ABC transporter ATP-binding protein n=1 Tax=Planktothrix serta TaxID=1678310 RepID=UPI0018CBF731|nr:ABC transporter ATP-binding protein [Planktothrix serta]
MVGDPKPPIPAVVVQDLVFGYLQQDPILQGISFSLTAGERIALLGQTGTGKSTLMENLIGLKQPNSGQIWIQGIPVQLTTLPEVRRRVGFCFQDPDDQLFMPTILEDVMFGPGNYGVDPEQALAQASRLLADFGLADCVNRSVYELSGGQKRLAALAAVLALEPAILILDEPTNGLDPWWRRELAQILSQLPVEVMLIASHDLQWISQVTQRAMILKQGTIQVDQPTEELLQDRYTLEQCGLPLDY